MLICLTALVSMGMGLIIGWYFTGHKYCIQLYRYKSISEKYLLFIRLYDVWMVNDAENHTIDQYLLERGIDSIAIYGMSHLGVRLYYGGVCFGSKSAGAAARPGNILPRKRRTTSGYGNCHGVICF